MHALHPDQVAELNEGDFPFRTLLPPEVGGPLAVYLLTVTHANPHTHADQDQIYIIRSGSGTMQIGEEQQVVGPGWLVHIPRGRQHALTPLGDEPVLLYSILLQAQ